MEIRQIRQIQAVIAVAKYSSFSLAAVELSFTASAVSKQVSALEKELGVRLFDRKASSAVSITPQGEALLPLFHKLLNTCEELEKTALSLSAPKNQILNFSSPPSLGNWGEDRLILHFYDKYPQISICYHSETGPRLVRKMAVKEIDVCTFFDINSCFEHLLLRNGLNPSSFGSILIEPCQLLLAFSQKMPQASKDYVEIQDFKHCSFLMKNFNVRTDQDIGTGHFRNFCHSFGFQPNIVFTNEQKRSLVFSRIAAGEAAAPILSRPEADYPGVVIRPVASTEGYAQKKLYYLKSNTSPALKAFLASSRELLR